MSAAVNGAEAEAPFQVMPPLSYSEYAALRDDVAERGILVPVVIDQHGRILDGHHRRQIADELGIDYPTEIRQVSHDDHARDLAFTLNAARRHLNRQQKRELIAREIAARPDDSDRAIARRLACSPSTVGAVRRGQVSNLDTDTHLTDDERHRLADLTRDAERGMRDATTGLMTLAITAMSNNISTVEIIMELTRGMRAMERNGQSEITSVIRSCVYEPVIDYVLDSATAEAWRKQWDHDTFKPLTADERSQVLEGLRGGEW